MATPVTIANVALSGNLLLSAIGVLIGGVLVGRTTRHGAGGDAVGLPASRCSSRWSRSSTSARWR